MKALRMIIHQTSANYKKEETVDNKMTYPLPPPSTMIGAIHKACGYTEYHEMDVSIQGKFESMHRKAYTDYCFLNSLQDDRGILVKMKNDSMLSRAFEKVASAKKSKGNSFRNNITINVFDEELLKEYQSLKELADEIKNFKSEIMLKIKSSKKRLAEKKKKLEKDSLAYQKVIKREKEIKEMEKKINERVKQYELENYTEPVSKYRSLTTSLKFYEILDQVDLVIHVKAAEEILQDILEHSYNLKAIGRSEDFIDLKEISIVELQEEFEEDEITSKNSAYLDMDLAREDVGERMIYTKIGKDNRTIIGTKYMLNTNYKIENNQRIFNKKKVLYASEYTIEDTCPEKNLYVDGNYIVNFLHAEN